MKDSQSPSEPEMTRIQKFGNQIADRVERWMPSPFLFAFILTYVAAIMAFVVEGAGPTEIALSWYNGFWDLLQFGMQMVIILLTTYVIAYHPRVKRFIQRITGIPNNGRQATVLVGVVTMLTGLIAWSLGLIFGAILAREMGKEAERNGLNVHYPLLAVAGYLAMSLTYGMGISSSAGLLMATEGNIFMESGVVDRVIPATEWVFHPYPITLAALTIIYAAIILYFLVPPKENARGFSYYVSDSIGTDTTDDSQEQSTSPSDTDAIGDGGTERVTSSEQPTNELKEGNTTLADKINNSRIIGGILALSGVALFLRAFLTEGLGVLDLNVLNFGFLMIGIILYTSPIDYYDEFFDAVRSSTGIILQFPFYAGIIGIMSGTGLVDTFANYLLSIATSETFPVIAWFTAAILNVFVPSGGGEWTITGGPMLTVSSELGVPYGQTIVAYSTGDAITNLFNPFWAIPLLAITELRAREMFGYAITVMLLLMPYIAIVLYLLPYNII